ncbi:hypothetical protein SDC9_209605 [bioreactor metagenome]|uniref:Uncharacterized protein n=1 Tax=bioreactor metagenome TaxID=1076179 RepID=A0A645JFJ1_9ZZZZ
MQNNARRVDSFTNMRFGGQPEKDLRLGQQGFRADALCAIKDLLAQSAKGTAQALSYQRLRMLLEPAGDDFRFQQFSDCWKLSEQFLFLIRHSLERLKAKG